MKCQKEVEFKYDADEISDELKVKTNGLLTILNNLISANIEDFSFSLNFANMPAESVEKVYPGVTTYNATASFKLPHDLINSQMKSFLQSRNNNNDNNEVAFDYHSVIRKLINLVKENIYAQLLISKNLEMELYEAYASNLADRLFSEAMFSQSNEPETDWNQAAKTQPELLLFPCPDEDTMDEKNSMTSSTNSLSCSSHRNMPPSTLQPLTCLERHVEFTEPDEQDATLRRHSLNSVEFFNRRKVNKFRRLNQLNVDAVGNLFTNMDITDEESMQDCINMRGRYRQPVLLSSLSTLGPSSNTTNKLVISNRNYKKPAIILPGGSGTDEDHRYTSSTTKSNPELNLLAAPSTLTEFKQYAKVTLKNYLNNKMTPSVANSNTSLSNTSTKSKSKRVTISTSSAGGYNGDEDSADVKRSIIFNEEDIDYVINDEDEQFSEPSRTAVESFAEGLSSSLFTDSMSQVKFLYSE
jgi:hypothetical protein